MATATENLPTKDLFDKFLEWRNSTRWAAVRLFAAAALLLAWSRSPDWRFKVPFNLFVNGSDKDLALPSGFAPIFGPIVILFFYAQLYVLNKDVLCVQRILGTRLGDTAPEKALIGPPFFFRTRPVIVPVLFVLLVLIASPVLTVWLFCDFLLLEHGQDVMWRSLYHVSTMWGVVPNHRGSSALVYVYGFVQPWLYIALTGFELWIAWSIGVDVYKWSSAKDAKPSGA